MISIHLPILSFESTDISSLRNSWRNGNGRFDRWPGWPAQATVWTSPRRPAFRRRGIRRRSRGCFINWGQWRFVYRYWGARFWLQFSHRIARGNRHLSRVTRLLTKAIIFYKSHFWKPTKNPTSYLVKVGYLNKPTLNPLLKNEKCYFEKWNLLKIMA